MAGGRATTTWAEIEDLLLQIEALQRGKVLDLARRLRPGLTLEDIANPHDFPELGDPDWQYEDGVLAGIQTVLASVRASLRDAEATSPGSPEAAPDGGKP